MNSRDPKALTGTIVDAAFRLHVGLGPGLLESVYQSVLARDLARRGLQVETERVVSFEYDGMRFDSWLRVDMLIENSVVVELKSVEQFAPVHPKQLLIYLRLLRLPVGLLLNFGAPASRMVSGALRMVTPLIHSLAQRQKKRFSHGATEETNCEVTRLRPESRGSVALCEIPF